MVEHLRALGHIGFFFRVRFRRAFCVAGFLKGFVMIWTIAVILLVLWLLGMVSSYTLGGFIHILLVVAVISVLVRLIQGRRVV